MKNEPLSFFSKLEKYSKIIQQKIEKQKENTKYLKNVRIFIEKLVSLDLQKCTKINEEKSFIEETIVDDSWILRIHLENNDYITFPWSKKEKFYIEIILTDEVSIEWNNDHIDLYYEDGRSFELIKSMFENATKIKIEYKWDRIIWTGIWYEENNEFLMMYSINFNPINWIKGFFWIEKRKEEIIKIDWK